MFPIEVPPLRSRGADAVLLARHFLQRMNERTGMSKVFSEQSLQIVAQHQWPGNVRELKHTVERAYILAGDVLEIGDALELSADLPLSDLDGAAERAPAVRISIGSTLSEVERMVIEATLEHFAGNKRITADALGCSLKTLYNKLNGYARAAGSA